MVNYYSVLGVANDAAPDEIKRRYKKLALQFHPDKTGNPADTERFHTIQQAYDTLKDSTLRRQYDSKNSIYATPSGYPNQNSRMNTHSAGYTSSHSSSHSSGNGYTTHSYSSHFHQSSPNGSGRGFGPSYFNWYHQNLRAYTDAYARNVHTEKTSDRAHERPAEKQPDAKSAATAAKLAQMAMQQELERRRREYMEAAARERAKPAPWSLYDLDGESDPAREYQQAKQRAHARHYTVYEVSESEEEQEREDTRKHEHEKQPYGNQHDEYVKEDEQGQQGEKLKQDDQDDGEDEFLYQHFQKNANADGSTHDSENNWRGDSDESDTDDSDSRNYVKQEYFRADADASADARGYDLAEPIVVEDVDDDTFHDAHPPVDGGDTSLDPDASRAESPEVVDLGPASPLRRPRLASQSNAFFDHRSLGPTYGANGNKRTKFAAMGDLRASLGTGLDDVDFGDMRLTLPETPNRAPSMSAQPSAKRAKVAEYSDGRSRAQTLFTPINKEFRRSSNGTISVADLAPEHDEAALVFHMPPPRIDTSRPLTAEKWAAHVEQLQKYERAFSEYRQAVLRYQQGRLEKDERHHNIIYSDTSCLDVFQTCLFNDMLLLQNYTRALQEFKDTLRQFCRDSAAVNAMT